jgi:8-oxo-dGTP pyrophosphatase MutT (NUDIX family)
MIKRRVAIIIFYSDKDFLIQDRINISKWGEEYGFFGGGIESGEAAEEALKREIKEELSIEIKNYKFFKHDIISVREFNGELERFVFIAPIPDIAKLNVKEGKMVIMNFKDSFNLKMVTGDAELLKEIYESLKK